MNSTLGKRMKNLIFILATSMLVLAGCGSSTSTSTSAAASAALPSRIAVL
jgi:uncharacterized lipoprotein YajG